MAQVYRETRIVNVSNRHWDNEAKHYVLDSVGSHRIELVIDLDALFTELGTRAARAKGKKATGQNGAVVAYRRM